MISGALSVTDWTLDGGVLVATLPEGAPPFFNLWVEDERRTLAQEPDTGFYTAAGTPTSLYDHLIFNSGEINPSWDLSHALVHTTHDYFGGWETSRLWISDVDFSNDSPGEFFFFMDTRELRYMPMDGEITESTSLDVPVLKQVLSIGRGTPGVRQGVFGIHEGSAAPTNRL